jgi:tRNA threonylcarbamoyladenosine modification (KEOPS) complex  Pcc1 subunit
LDAKARVRMQFSSEKHLKTLLYGLAPETGASNNRRAKVALSREGTFLVLEVAAKDTVALRSTLNAYLRWIDSTVKVLEVIETPS